MVHYGAKYTVMKARAIAQLKTRIKEECYKILLARLDQPVSPVPKRSSVTKRHADIVHYSAKWSIVPTVSDSVAVIKLYIFSQQLNSCYNLKCYVVEPFQYNRG